ncbi:hypothetical protein Gorai_013390, partial [Gossypium raimondii]|nr:hypothetical protein [Gossypium raimondii]
MRKNDVGEEDHLMAVDVIGISNGIEKPANSRVSFQDMLLGASRVRDRVRSNRIMMTYSFLIEMLLLEQRIVYPLFISLIGFIKSYIKSILKSIRDTIGKVIKLDVNTGNAQRGRFVRMAIFLDLNNPLVSKIKSLGEMNQENLISDENRKDLDIFGPWMVVNRRNSILSRKSAIGREERKGSTVSQGLDQALGLVDPNAAGSSKMVNGSSKQSAKVSAGLKTRGFGPFRMGSRLSGSKNFQRANTFIFFESNPTPYLCIEGEVNSKETPILISHDNSSRELNLLTQGTLRILVEKSVVTTLIPKFHSVIKFVGNRDPNSHSVDMNSAVSLSSLKIGNLKRFKNGSYNLRGKGNKF